MNRLHELYKMAPFTSQYVRRAVETAAKNLPAEQKGALLHYKGLSAGVFQLKDVSDAALLLESLASRSADEIIGYTWRSWRTAERLSGIRRQISGVAGGMYARMSQHLVVFHKIQNKEERKLLLSLESGWVNIQSCLCPVAGCGKATTQIDRHMKLHTELSSAEKETAVWTCKRKKVIGQLAALRATNPELPLVSTLDLEPDLGEADMFFEEEREEECSNPGCKILIEKLKMEISNLNQSNDTLTDALRNVTLKYHRLQRRSESRGAGRLSKSTRRLISSLGSGGDPSADTSTVQPSSDLEPSTSQQPPSFEEPDESDHGSTLTLLESDVATTVLQWEFYGHMSAYLAALYGHRGGVLQNITIKEVEEAQESPSDNVFCINIKFHKTNQMFGPAQIAVTTEEYGWMQRFLKIRRRLPGGSTAKYFFFTSTSNICKKLVTYFRSSWKAMGLPGSPNFTDLRTSIASHAKFTHSESDRLKISKFMCHDVQTADRFYVTNLSAKQAVEHRRLFEAALEGEDNSAAGLK
ncbi:unnamed protein product [Leuciscus chuanchicus]